MKYTQLMLMALLLCAGQCLSAQTANKVYEITITTTDKDGNTEVKDFVIEGEDMSQEEIDALVQEQLDGVEAEVDVNVNVNVTKVGEASGEESKTITKIVKQRSNLGDENKIILEEQDMEIEVIDEKVYINGEEVKEGDFGDTKVRILKFEEGDDYELEELLEEENIEIGEGENIYFIEKEENKEGVAFLGVVIGRTAEDGGVLVRNVVAGTSAEKMGLQKGDKVISINGKEVNSFSSLSKTVKAYLPGEEVKVVYSREGEVKEAMIALSDYKKQREEGRSWTEKPSGKSHGHRGKRKHHKRRDSDQNNPLLSVMVAPKEDEIFVTRVFPGGAAEKAGVQIGDQIISVNKVEMKSTQQFYHAIKANAVGDEIKMKLIREGKKMKVKATLLSAEEINDQRYPNNTSQRIERIIIKDKQEVDERNAEQRSTIKFNEFALSPNPSPGIVKVDFTMDELKEGESLVTRIISVDGKVVRENTVSDFDGRYIKEYDLSDVGAGIYLFQVEKNDQKFIERFLIERK